MPLNPGPTRIDDLFSLDRSFEIPVYQRPYSWEEQQVLDLFDDINSSTLEKPHFAGTLLLRETSRMQGPLQIIEVVDGQQRLTTLQILVSEVVRRLEGALDPSLARRLRERYFTIDGVPKLSPLAFDSQFYNDHIIGGQPYPNAPLTPSQRRLRLARDTLRSKLGQFSPPDAQAFLDRSRQLKVLVYTIADAGEATLIFETTNDRGRPLSNLEKTKSFLMHQLYLSVADPSADLESANRIFARIYSMLDSLEENPIQSLEDDQVQRYHFVVSQNWNSRVDYQNYFTFLKRGLLGLTRSGKLKEAEDFVLDYCSGLLSVFEACRELIDQASRENEPLGRRLADVFLLGRTALLLPVLSASWIRQADGPAGGDSAAFGRLVRMGEICSLRCYGVGRKRSDAGESELYELGWDVFNRKKTTTDAVELLKEFVKRQVPRPEFEERLRDPYFRQNVSDGDIKYLLWKYEEAIRSQTQPKEPLSVSAQDVFSDKVQIEHILPRESGLPPEQTEHIVDKLGNLSLASRSSNASMGNRPFREKAGNYYANSVFRMQRELVKHQQWGEAEINARTDTLVDFALRRWSAK